MVTTCGGTASELVARALKTRAAQLARMPAQTEDEGSVGLLRFRVAGALYAIEIEHVVAVMALGELTPVPCTPAYVAGVINVRGRVTAVLDLLAWLNLPAPGLTDFHHVVLLQHGDFSFGLLADVVLEVAEHATAGGQAVAREAAERPHSHCKAVGADGLVVLDVESIVRDTRFNIHEEIR